MSKFCKNCGAVLNDDMVFCNSCGAQQEVPVAQAPVAEAKANPIEKLKGLGTKKLAIMGGIAVGVIAVVIIAIVLISSLSGYNKAIDNYEAVLNGKADKIADLAPEEYWSYMAKQSDTSKSKYLDEKIDKYEDNYSDRIEELEDEVGNDPKITLKVLDNEKIDKKDLEEIAEALDEQYKISEDSVKSGYDLIVKITYKGSDDSDFNAGTMAAVQIGSSRYLINYYEYDDGMRVSFIIPS